MKRYGYYRPRALHLNSLSSAAYKLFTIQMIKQIINKLPSNPYPNIFASPYRVSSPSTIRINCVHSKRGSQSGELLRQM